MFYKLKYMSVNFIKTYKYILYFIYMSLHFSMHILMYRTIENVSRTAHHIS